MPRPDLQAVDELCRLVLVARRLGCRVQLADVPVDLRALLELAGVADVVLADPDPDPTHDHDPTTSTRSADLR